MCAVYGDDMFKYPLGKFRRMKMSHMIADTEEELHEMAAKIGLARKHYQRDHYDVSMSYRLKAIELGAKPIVLKTLATMYLRRRVEGVLGLPEEAAAWRTARYADKS